LCHVDVASSSTSTGGSNGKKGGDKKTKAILIVVGVVVTILMSIGGVGWYFACDPQLVETMASIVVAYLVVIDFVIPVSCGAIIPRVML
jgi:hypothetical protein